MPAVSVIMPVYNASAYLRKAIDSILNQTLTDFELLIVNDCSTDNSEAIIKSYPDPRIKYIRQPENYGVVAAMNAGLNIASAPFSAVMHADDIAFTNRLEKQFNFLQSNPDTAVVAGFIISINETGEQRGEWKEDRENISAQQIKNEMIRGNCIAHSSVMMQTGLIKKYSYTSSLKHKGYAVEDYPLWLHLLADGYLIQKIAEPVLYYRMHSLSATNTFLRKKNAYFINFYSKKFFLQQRKEKGKLNGFDKKIQISMYKDWILGIMKEIKKKFTA